MRVSPFCFFSLLSIKKKFGCVQCLAFAFVILLPIAHPAFHPVSMVSPLNVSQFTLNLAGHPDRQAVAYVLNGLQHGFRLGFQPARKLKPARKNKPSARIPRSLMIIWPLRWLVVGLQAPSHHPLCPTYKLAVSG